MPQGVRACLSLVNPLYVYVKVSSRLLNCGFRYLRDGGDKYMKVLKSGCEVTEGDETDRQRERDWENPTGTYGGRKT